MSALMLVSADASAAVRREVELGLRPRPEYLVLEERFGVNVLDWSRLAAGTGRRSVSQSLRHVAAAMRILDEHDTVLSDGEHVGIPLALALTGRAHRPRHVMIGHQLVTRSKFAFFKMLRAHRHIDRVVVHSQRHLEAVVGRLGVPRTKLECIPYGIDTTFWQPKGEATEDLVLAPGRDHRDFDTLARACASLNSRVYVTLGSLHSPVAQALIPKAWPRNFGARYFDFISLRDMYARARVVVVPMMPVDFPAGVTTVLEAMAMGKAVVVSATAGLEGLVENRHTGLTVPPGDADRLREAVMSLLQSPNERARLGANARQAAVERFDLGAYASTLASHLGAPLRAPAADAQGQLSLR